MGSNEETNAAGTDTRPPMLVESDYDSWKIRIHRYIRGKPNGKLIWKSIQNGPTPHPMITDPPPTGSTVVPAPRKKLDSEFNEEENKLEMADTQAEIILSQGLPRHIFNILNQTSTAKEIWDNVELLMQGSGRTLQQRKEDLFDEYERFRAIGNESIHDYFVRFHKLVNDMKITQLNIPTHQMNTKFVNNLPAYWGKYVTNVKQNMDISTTPYVQIYTHLKAYEPHAKKTLKKQEQSTSIVDPLAYVAHTTSAPALSSPSTPSPQPTAQSPNDALMATMTQIANLLSGFQKQFPPTNNQLRTSSNSRTHATVHDGHIVTEPVQRKAPGNNGNTGTRGKKVICYNCRGEGHVARQCKEPKRKMDSQYFKDKALLMEAKEKGDVLDAEAEAFLADVECTAPYDQPQALTTTNMFQANHEDAYDSDVDEGPNAAVAFMANLSSTSATNNPVNEVHSNDNQIFDNVDYQSNQEMHQEEHLDSDAETEIDDNTIPYHQYLLDTEAQNVPTEVSADTSDKVSMIAILTDLQTQLDGHAKCMRTRRSNYPNNSNVTIPRRRRRQVSNIVEPEIRTIVAPMAERTMEELLWAPTKGYGEAIVLPEINADHFEIKTNLLQLVQVNPFNGHENENPHAHINSFKRITSTLRFRNVPNNVIKLMMFPYSLEGAAKTWYEKEPPNSNLTWEDLVTNEAWERFKELLRACPHHGFTELTQVDTFYNGLNENEQDFLNAAAGRNLLSKTTREALNKIENKSKVRYSRNRSNASRMNATSSKTDERIDKLADQLSTLVEIVSKKVGTPAPVKAVEESCVTCGGAHSWYNCPATDNNQASVCATTGTYNQVNPPNRVSNQMAPPGFAPVQNNGQNRNYQNQNQGNNFNRGNNFHQNQGFQNQVNHVPNFQNQGFQNQPFQAHNNQFQQGIPSEITSYMKANESIVRNMQGQINEIRSTLTKQEENLRKNLNNDMRSILGSFFQNQASTSGTLPSNTIPNHKGEMKAITTRSGVAYEGPSIPTNPSPKKSRDKASNQMEKIFQIFQDLRFDINFMDALLLMPRFAPTIKSLLMNKEKLFELA
ncbi:reverse transcriptase domain-containing protein [Tanacetum coccineum]